jgi:DNA repair protein RadC
VLHAAEAGACLPWVRVTRDPERYEACLAKAQAIGPVANARKVYELLSPTLAQEDQEIFLVVLCDVRGQLRGVAEVARGQRSRVGVGVIDVMRVARAVQDQVLHSGAEIFVVVHNHPSGNPEPSAQDRKLTETIREATRPYGSELTFADHVIVGMGAFYSMAGPEVRGRASWKGERYEA